MATFKLQIFEDCLLNKDEFIEFLQTSPDTLIELTTDKEGPSLNQCGVVDILLNSGRDLDKISVTTPNWYEKLPIRFTYQPKRWNHWFIYCKQATEIYKFSKQQQSQTRLGCFIGRKNLDRLAILYWLSRRLNVFLSSLREDHINYEHRSDIEHWVDNIYSFESWVKEFDIPSIDNYSVDDQYQSIDFADQKNQFLKVQLNMLNWYGQFDVELVCETFVRGDTYFPTEKTVRPIIGEKPMLVYGPKNYLKNLRKQGFETWADCWDESYDQYEGYERWNRMKDVITQIYAWGDWEWNPIMKQATEIAVRNKQLFKKEVPSAF